MRKIIVAGLAFMLLLSGGLPIPLSSQEAAADEAWIEVDTPAEFYAIRDGLGLNYRLTADIDLSAYSAGDGWVPIGDTAAQAFTGRLDGNGYAIHNLTMNRPSANYQGLFRHIQSATITELSLFNVNVTGHEYTGSLVGRAADSNLSNITVQGSVTGNSSAGGIVGYLSLGRLSASNMHGAVKIGSAPEDSYGGLVGYNTGTITGSYSTASVPDAVDAGGLVGLDERDQVSTSYWDRDTSGQSVSAGSEASFGKTTAEMKQQATYAGWDFTNVWGIVEHATYPLSRANFNKVALQSLVVTDPDDGETIAFDREFDAGYGVYEARVFYRTDEITITPTTVDGTSSVTVEGHAAPHTIGLVPGANEIEITVTPAVGPLRATYTLTVYRDEGTPSSPHRIVSADQLAAIGDAAAGYDLNDAYALETDLDLTAFSAGAGWQPIGSESVPFAGSFDGRGHAIRNLTIARPSEDGVGLFGGVAGAAELRNLALLGVHIAGNDSVGALAGSAADAVLTNITVRGVVDGAAHVGGIVGRTTGMSGSRLSMQGSVQASQDAAGGLIGAVDTSDPVSIQQSYSAASVTAGASSGGLIGAAGSGTTAADSFWDTEASGQSASSGGGTGYATASMYERSTYIDAGWTFGPGGWAITSGSDYPMPYDTYDKVRLSALAVTAAGATVSGFGSFDPGIGRYDMSLDTPVEAATVTASAADASAAVAIAGNAGSPGTIDLGLGDNAAVVTVTNNGWQGRYQLHLAVPTPEADGVTAPADGWYGIGDTLTFTVSYDLPVEVASTPSLRLTVGAVERAAGYAAADSAAASLKFQYAVQAGDADTDGIAFAQDAIAVEAPAAITALNEAVPVTLAGLLPDMSGIRIDGALPTITLTPSVTTPTRDGVDVEVTADGTGSAITDLKWAAGNRNEAYFATDGTTVAGGSFEATGNGIYTVYAEDSAGNRAVSAIEIRNLTSEAPILTLTRGTTAPVNTAVEVSVTALASDEAADNAITALRWAAGSQNEAYFIAGGTTIAGGSFETTANGTFTVYAKDTAGNEAVATIAIDNITRTAPLLTLVPATTDLVNAGFEVAVTAEASDEAAGNAIAALKWSAGERDEAYFGAGGAAVTGASFEAAANGTYTVYAMDTAGNEAVATIDIDNIANTAPLLTLVPATTDLVNAGFEVMVTAEASDEAAGNAIAALKWSAGERDEAYFGAGGTAVTGGSFEVTANGTYTVYAKDAAGNEAVATIDIDNITRTAPLLTLVLATTDPVNAGIEITVGAEASDEAAGNAIAALKWSAGERDEAYFGAGGAAVTGGSFEVTANGTYTVYAKDTAGNEAVAAIAIDNITRVTPLLTLVPETTDLVNAGVEVTVAAEASDEAAGNAIAALKWSAGERDEAYFGAGGAAVTGGSFAATANGTYTVYARDTAGNESVGTIAIDEIVTEGPAIAVDVDPAGSTTAPVTVTVSAVAGKADRGNAVALLKWAAGEIDEAGMADPATGSELVSGGSFEAAENGTYTLYAVDALGNARTESIVIANIRPPYTPSIYVGDPNVYRFTIVPGQAYTLPIEGLTLRIPAGAIDRTMTITMEVVKEAADEVKLDAGLRQLSRQYELTKSSQGAFIMPVVLEFERDESGLQADERLVVHYYDEAAKQWVPLPSPSTANDMNVSGETDHFTRFAVMAVPVEEDSNVEESLADIAGHWAAREIREAVAAGIVHGYPDGNFLPDKTVSRAEIAVLLHRLLEWPVAASASESAFADQADVPAWAEAAVASAVKAGVIGGYPDQSFKPAARVNRAEAALMLVRAAGIPASEAAGTTFADDAAIGGWAKGSIAAAHAAGLIQGQDGNRFNPDADLTRAEAVVMLLRLQDYLQER